MGWDGMGWDGRWEGGDWGCWRIGDEYETYEGSGSIDVSGIWKRGGEEKNVEKEEEDAGEEREMH